MTASFRLAASLALLLIAAPALAERVAEHGDWVAVAEQESGASVCHMSATPTKAEGKYTKRGEALLYVTHRPAEKSVHVVSVQAGYTYKAGSEVVITIDKSKIFRLIPEGGYAWTSDFQADKDLVRAMRAGSTMVIKGTSSRGTLTTDTYSLKGFTAAHKAINRACGVK